MAATAGAIGKLGRKTTALLICDVQEAFRPVIAGFPAVIDTARRMVRGAGALGVPVLATEQAPAKLGATVPELRDVLPAGAPVLPKTLFSMWTPEVERELAQRHPGVRQFLLCGIEGHVCVLQTALDLLERGLEVHVVTDGVSSQRPADREAALARMAQSGAFLVTSEMALFQLTRDAAADGFKAVSALAREPRSDLLPPPGSRM